MAILGLTGAAFAQEPADAEKAKQISELEKQINAIQKQLNDLKTQPAKKVLGFNDANLWKNVNAPTISDDGAWFACRIGSAESESEIILQQVKADKPAIKAPAGSLMGPMAFSRDSKWFAYTVVPQPPRPGAAAGSGKRVTKVVLVNLTTNEKTEFEGLRSFSFNGEASSHILFRKANPEAAPGGPVGIPMASPPSAPPAPNNDLVIRELATGAEQILGNVGDFAFNKKGTHAVLTIDALGQIGNGVQLREMKTGVTQTLDTAKAAYQSIVWKDTGDAFTVLRGVDETGVEGKVFSVVGFHDVGPATKKVVFEPKTEASFPKDFGITANRPAFWSDDLSGFFVGIVAQKRPETKKDEPKKEEPKKEEAKKEEPKKEAPKGEPGPAPRTAVNEAGPTPRTTPKPDMVIWHWKDERLQPAQQVQAASDKAYSYLGLYRVKEKKFLRLADDTLKIVQGAPKHQYAIGIDRAPYQLNSTLDGKSFQDIYVINLTTGERKKALTKVRFVTSLSPDGTHLSYHEDGHFKALEFATLKTYVMSEKAPKPFIDTEDDHNVDKPPTRMLGWSGDGKFAIVSDNWDLWQLAVHGETAVNLTVNGQATGVRYRDRVSTDPDEKGIDLAKPMLLSTYGEWTKKSGYSNLEPGKPGATPLIFEDAAIQGISKSRNADAYVYIRQSSLESPEAVVTDGTFKAPKKMTNSNPQQAQFQWSAGSKLVDYVGLNNQKMQAALYLPAGYQPGKKYPTVIYIYEKLSQNLHSYTPPGTGGGFNKSIYTSNGYAVLMPDIAYQLNDPGISALKCIIPALDAAIATGIVDGDKVGLQGHSWGGYQTAFMITQTDRLKAACAGAPLTDLVSMYSSVYWNSGSANQPIFESSQGRFTGPYWEQQEAYLRNSPVFHATKVKTPLLLLHNDKDGAVDFTQGVEYFNTLRRLQKPVVMLQYKGENHGLVKPENRKDYAIRMKEFFDHYLMGKPAADWWTAGVPHLKLDDHLKNRKD